MIRKSIGLLALTLVVLTTACKQESAADKITEADLKAIEAEKALVGKMPKVKLDKETLKELQAKDIPFTPVPPPLPEEKLVVNYENTRGRK